MTLNSKKQELLEQEKISFQEYWQTSEFHKIKTEIQNRNKEFQNNKKTETKNQPDDILNHIRMFG